MFLFDIRNYRRVESAKFGVSAIAFVGALNGNGKTSLAQAVGALMTGERIPPGLPLNLSEAGALVRSGAPDARLSLEMEGDDLQGGAVLTYPKAEYKTNGVPPRCSTFAAGLESVLDMDAKKRGLTLARYLKSEPTKEDLLQAIARANIVAQEGKPKDAATDEEKADMESLGLSPDKPYDLRLYRYFAAVWKGIETGSWDTVLKDAKGYGQKQKGAWESITGEKAYQPTGADTWRPKTADWDDELLTTSVETLEAEVVEAHQTLEAEIAKGAVDKAEVNRLQQVADSYKAGEHNKARDTLAQYEVEIPKEEAKLAALPKPEDVPIIVSCDHCGADNQLVIGHGQDGTTTYALRAQIEGISAEENAARRKAIADQQGIVSRYKTQRDNYARMVERFQADKEAAAAAKAKLDELLAAPDNSEAIEAARSKLAQAKGRLEAKLQKDKADKAHRNVQNNQRLIDILAPDGLRRKKLVDVVESFNGGILGPLCEAAGWQPVTIDEDMQFRYGGFPHHLLAESHQYRVRVVVQTAMARLDSSAMVVIDGADVLDRKARIGLLQMVMGTQIPALLLATYDTPDKLPQLYKVPGGATYWLENGVLQSVGVVKAAAE